MLSNCLKEIKVPGERFRSDFLRYWWYVYFNLFGFGRLCLSDSCTLKVQYFGAAFSSFAPLYCIVQP